MERLELPQVDCSDLPRDGDPLGALRSLERAEPSAIDEALRQVHCRYPGRTRLATLTTSHQGRPVRALWIGQGVDGSHERPSFLLNGGHHGDEHISTDFVLDAIALLLSAEDPRTKRWLAEVVTVAIPVVNPDGRAISVTVNRSGRKNGRDNDGDGQRSATEGVDINRNYPFYWGALGDDASRADGNHKWYRGPFPGSEPETRAIMKLAIAEHFVAAVSFHSGAVSLLAPYTIDGVRDPEPPLARLIGGEAIRQMPPHPQGPMEFKRNLYPVDGTDQDWHYARHGTVALLVEGARKSALGPWDRQHTFISLRAIWGYLIDRYLDGPSIWGHVVDAAGTPTDAAVAVTEVALHEGERWRTRCRDGRFDRYLPRPGTYTLRVEAPGVTPVEKRVSVARGRVRVDVVLDGVMPYRPPCPAALLDPTP